MTTYNQVAEVVFPASNSGDCDRCACAFARSDGNRVGSFGCRTSSATPTHVRRATRNGDVSYPMQLMRIHSECLWAWSRTKVAAGTRCDRSGVLGACLLPRKKFRSRSTPANAEVIVHGTADRIKIADSFVEALKNAGAKHVEYMRIEGAGHGLIRRHADKINPAMEKFFAKHLGMK